jgi:hypothetical protein
MKTQTLKPNQLKLSRNDENEYEYKHKLNITIQFLY